ncbi:MAG: tetratricopeptide repeat protein [Thermodesulfobacteriota bacterium]|nr:tetratricopeptide repeat protein [Thermodesulfobacteriota bacterium]
MKELLKTPREDQDFNDDIEIIKKKLDLEKDKEKRSILCAKLWHAYYRKGSNYFDHGDYKAALQQHLKALEFNEYVEQEGVFNLFMSVGIEYEKIAEYDQAISYYKQLLDLSHIEKDDKTMLLQFIGQCFDKKGEEKSAYDYFKELFSINKHYDGDWYLVYRYAKLAYKYREFRTSLEYFNAALKIIPANERSYIQSSLQCLGYIFLEKESYKEAITHFKKALKMKAGLDKIESEILSGMAQAYFGRNKFAQAIKYSKKAIEEPHDDEISERSYFLLAFCYSVKKDKQKEQYYIDKLQSLRPNSPYLKDLL